jgi:hypothetical protein
MAVDETTPLIAGEEPIIGGYVVEDEENRVKDAPDGPRIPGVKLEYILPAMAIGVCIFFPSYI